MEKTISVIVPVYNVEAYLDRCVRSILAQSYGRLELILVDDGSTDGSGRLCDALAETDSRIRVIHKPNGGLSSARNAGLEMAKGDCIAFVDSDDWVVEDAYEAMLACMERTGAGIVVAGRYDVSGKTGEKTLGLCPKKEELLTGEELMGRIFLWDGCDSSAWDKLFARDVLEGFRFPLGKVSEDVAVMYRIILKAGQAAMLPKPIYCYFHRPGSITTTKKISEKTFHFSQHTEVIYDHIRENHPAIEKQARYFRVKALLHLLLTLELSPVRRDYCQQIRQTRKALGGHLLFAIGCPWLSAREKATALLLRLGLYRLARPIFHRG